MKASTQATEREQEQVIISSILLLMYCTYPSAPPLSLELRHLLMKHFTLFRSPTSGLLCIPGEQLRIL